MHSMKERVGKVLAGLTLALGMGSGSLEAAGDWEILFDGSSTDAFRAFRRDTFPTGGWRIEEGQLRTVKGGDTVDIVTRKTYRDFELAFEWKVAPGANSGVMYRVSEAFRSSWHTGPEYQILDDDRHADGRDPRTSAGSFYALVAPGNGTLEPVGEYNTSRIIARGRRIEHWLNGEKVVALDLDTHAVNTLISRSKFARLPRFAREESGHICFQHHRDEVWFRDIRVRTLPRPEVLPTAKHHNRLSAAEEAAGWKSLFNGRGTRPWRGFMRKEFPDRGWVIDGDTLRHESRAGGGDIVTRQEFGQFDFRFEWRIAEGGNSGVKYFIMEERRGRPIGHEYQLLDDSGHPDALRGTKRQTAALYDCLPAANRILRPIGEFNESRILVEKDRVEHWLNGVMVLGYALDGPSLQAAVAGSKFRDVADFGKFHRGRILLQDHGDEVAFRNLRIRDLDRERP